MPPRSHSKKRHPWPTLMVAAAATELLYLLLARTAMTPARTAWGARWYSPALFEETLPFYAVWAGLLVFYSLAIHTLRSLSGRRATAFIFLTSIAFRATLLPSSGFDGLTPSELLLSPRSSPLDRVMAHAANGLSSAASRAGLTGHPDLALRTLTVGADVVSLALGPGLLKAAGLPAPLVLLYGWNPLAVKESAASARPASLGVMLLALTFYGLIKGSRLGAALAYGGSLAAYPLNAACLPATARRLGSTALVGVGLAGAAWTYHIGSAEPGGWLEVDGRTGPGASLLPAVGSLMRLFLTRDPFTPAAFCIGAWLAFAVYRATRAPAEARRLPSEALLALGGFLMVAPRVLPWSFVPIAYLAAFSSNRGWLVFTATAPLTYLALGEGSWSFWLGFTQYFPAYCALIFGALGGEPSDA